MIRAVDTVGYEELEPSDTTLEVKIQIEERLFKERDQGSLNKDGHPCQ